MITTIEHVNSVGIEVYEYDIDDATSDYRWSTYKEDYYDAADGTYTCFIGCATPRAWLVINALTNTGENATVVMPLRVEVEALLLGLTTEWSLNDIETTAVHWEYLDSYDIFSDKAISDDAEDIGRMQDKAIEYVRQFVKHDTHIVDIKRGKHPYGEYMRV